MSVHTPSESHLAGANPPEVQETKSASSHSQIYRMRSLATLMSLLAAFALTGWLATSVFTRLGENQARDRIRMLASSASASLDPALVALLSGSTMDKDTEEYRVVREQLARVRQSSSKFRFVYLMGITKGQVIFLADAESESSDDYSAPGDPYDEASPALLKAFEHGESFVEGPFHDQWGEWVSGHAAIRNPQTGAVLALLGVDIDAAVWRKDMTAYHWLGFELFGFLLIIGLLFAFHVIHVERMNGHLRHEVVLRTNTEAQLNKAYTVLSAKEQELAAILHNTPDLIYRLDPEGNITFINESIKNYGYEAEDVLGRNILEFVHPDDRELASYRINERRTGDRSVKQLELRLFRNDHTAISTECLSVGLEEERSFVVNAEGLYASPESQTDCFIGTQGVARDITERKKVEQDLQSEMNKLKTLMDGLTQAGVGVDIVDADHHIVYQNAFIENCFGPSEQQKCFTQYMGRSEPCNPCDKVRAIANNNVQIREHRGPDDRTYLLHSLPFSQSQDEPGCIMEVIFDITELNNAKDALRKSEERYRALFDAAGDAILLIETDRFVDCNKKAQEMFGAPRQAIIGQSPDTFSPDQQPDGKNSKAMAVKKTQSALAGKTKPYKWTHCRQDGKTFDAEVTLTHLEYSGKSYLLSIVRDKTHEAQLEAQLQQAQKHEAIGTLAGGIAHDFNNILSGILGYATLAKDELPQNASSHQYLNGVIQGGERAAELVQQILTFSRQTGQERRPLRLSPMVKETLKLLRATIPTSIEVRQNIPSNGPLIFANSTQMQQVLMNLCTNAYHSMEETGGVLSVALNSEHLHQEDTAGYLELPSGQYVCISVADTGCGMDEMTKQRIFEPYFTTKPEGKGSGMGLATTHGIVTSHEGAIHVYSEKGRGTEFRVYLPIASTPEETPDRHVKTCPKGKGEHILLVDDEESILSVTQKVLEYLGYKTTAHTSPDKALQCFLSNPDDIDIVITDNSMPKLTGLSLAELLLERRPDLPIILTTGLGDENVHKKALELGIRSVVGKPASREELAHAVADSQICVQ